MKTNRLIGFIFLGIVWLWLVWAVLSQSKITLINLFWVVASGIIIFVPLWKRYGPSKDESAESDSPATRKSKNRNRR